MTRLYARILLSFWAVMIAVVIGAVGLTWLVLLERADDLGRAPASLGPAATRALSDGGEPGLVQWLEDAVRRHRDELHIYVVGPDGHELLGRPLPMRAQFALGRGAEYGRGEGPGEGPPPSPLAARLLPPRPLPVLVSAKGVEYRLVVIAHRGMLGPFEQPWARLGYFFVAILVTGIASLLLTRSISRPVRALGIAARSLAGGDLAARVAAPVSRRKDELGGLARDFDAMAVRLQELVDAKERLLQDVSHELRSPLARMRVALGLARQSGGDVGTQLDRIELEAERLDALIGQVLALSRLDARGDGQCRDAVDLGDLVDDIARDARFEAQARGVRVEWEPPRVPVRVEGDSALLASAIENVVRNALRYTREASTVVVALEADSARARVVVSDEGPGVPEAELARIFAPFHRVASSRGRDSGGDGLGLAITERVLRTHGGSARAVNRTGGGLVVTLELPRSA